MFTVNSHLSRCLLLMLENIEALADSETDGVRCFGKGLVDCPLNHDKVYVYYAPYSLYY